MERGCVFGCRRRSYHRVPQVRIGTPVCVQQARHGDVVLCFHTSRMAWDGERVIDAEQALQNRLGVVVHNTFEHTCGEDALCIVVLAVDDLGDDAV